MLCNPCLLSVLVLLREETEEREGKTETHYRAQAGLERTLILFSLLGSVWDCMHCSTWLRSLYFLLIVPQLSGGSVHSFSAYTVICLLFIIIVLNVSRYCAMSIFPSSSCTLPFPRPFLPVAWLVTSSTCSAFRPAQVFLCVPFLLLKPPTY